MGMVWKIFEYGDGAELKTLFHGVDGSRTLTLGKIIKANKKMVSDGSSSTQYESGFHTLPTYEDAVDYLQSFTSNKRRMAVVRVFGLARKPKSHSRKPVELCDRLFVPVSWTGDVFEIKDGKWVKTITTSQGESLCQ